MNRKIEGIAEVRDESDREGLQIVIELKKDANPDGILNYLFKNTDLQINYNFNMVAINERRPEQVGMADILQAYVTHQKEVITRRTNFNLNKAEARLHIVEALIKVMSILDEVIHLIRNSKDKKDSKENLVKSFDFTDIQAEAIVSLQLYRLTNTDIVALQNEKLDLSEQIASYNSILNNEKVLYKVMKSELSSIKKKYATPRMSVIEEEIEEIKIETEVLVPEEEVFVVLTKEGYYKRTNQRSFSASELDSIGLREGDQPILLEKASTLDAIAIFTSKGNYIHFPIYELPELKWKDMGHHLSQNIPFATDEEIIAAKILPYDEKQLENQLVLFITKEGLIKQTELSEYKTFRGYKRKKSVAIKLKTKTDQVQSIHFVDVNDHDEILLVTHMGYALRYSLEEASITGVRTSGVKAINLKSDDYVVGGTVFESGNEKYSVLVMTQRGNVKRFRTGEIPCSSRATRGLLLIKELKTNPHRIVYMDEASELNTVYTIKTSRGNKKEILNKDISYTARYTNGSSFLNEQTEGEVFSVKKLFFSSQIIE